MNEEQNNVKKENNNIVMIIAVIVVVVAVAVFVYFMVSKNNNKDNPTNNPGEPEVKALYNMNQKDLVTFSHKYCNSELKEIAADSKTVKINYPVFTGTDETITNLNAEILERVNGYVDNFIIDGRDVNNEELQNSQECVFVNVATDNTMKRYDNYEHMDYKVIETEGYLFAVESFHLEMAGGRAGTDVFNVYNIDKKTGKVIENKEIIKNVTNIVEVENLIVSYVEKDENKEYEYLEKEIYNKVISKLKEKIEKDDYKLYYEENGNIVIVLNELENWSTYRFMYDITTKTVSVYQ